MPSWIRVDTHISRDPRLTKARRILQVDKATMVGHYVLLEAELAEQRPTGELAGLNPEVLAEWAGFDGEIARFKKAIAALTEKGKLAGWDDTQGRRIEYLENEKERKRQFREKRKREKEEREAAKKAAEGASSPPDVRGRSEDVQQVRYGTVRNDTVRYGTEGQLLESSADEAVGVVPEQLERASDARANDNDAARSPLAHANSGTANGNGTARDTFALPPAARSLLEKCYGQSRIKGRYVEVREQLLATLTPAGARLEGDEHVRAVDETHLDAACTAVLASALKKPDGAIRVVLLKLRDTYADRLAGVQALGAMAKRTGRGGAATRPADVLVAPAPETVDRPKAKERRAKALAWAKEHPTRATLIERRLRKEHPSMSDHSLAEFLIAEFAQAMEADAKGVAPEPEPAAAAAGGV